MQTALPLVRSASHAIATPASRIPHLEYHIVRKLHRSKKTNNLLRPAPQRQQSRTRTSTADVNLNSLWPTPTYETPVPNEYETSHSPAESSVSFKTTTRSRTIDFNTNDIPQYVSTQVAGFTDLSSTAHEISASRLLDEASPERLLTWLAAHPEGHAFTASATREEFDRAFCALDPGVLADPFVRAHKHLGRATDADWELSFRRSLVNRLRLFAVKIDEILMRRREFGAQLTLNTCRHALKCAASVGDVRVADHIWDNLMSNTGIEPDISCYNAYLHAHMWNLAFSEVARKSFRNTTRNLKLRSRLQRPANLIGYSVSTQTPEPDWTLRSRTLAIFAKITDQGLTTDEGVFVNLIIGLGRSADLPGVNSILKSVWNIDVDALESYDEEELESPTFYDESHPLKPTAKLLYAVVHSCSINHRVDKAWNLLDYISRSYALVIPDYIWDELIEWTFVLSQPRSQARRVQGQMEGKIQMREVENLFNTLTDEPHNVRPSPIALDLLTRSYRKRHMLDRTLDTIRAAEDDMLQRLDELKLMVETIKAMIQDPQGIVDNGMLSKNFIRFRNDFQLLYLSIRQQYAFLITETKRIIKEDDFAGSGKERTWSTQTLPQVIEEFEQYLPSSCRYRTRTGRVELNVAEHRDAAQNAGLIRPLLLEANTIWEALDTLDLFNMATNLQRLSVKLKNVQERDGARISPSLQKNN